MTQDEKALKYDELIGSSDVVSRELSKLQSGNAGVATTSREYDEKVNFLKNKLIFFESEMKKLFI